MSRNPPRDPSGDYVQPVWMAWQAAGPSSYRVWLVISSQFLVQVRRTIEALLQELSYAVGGAVVTG